MPRGTLEVGHLFGFYGIHLEAYYRGLLVDFHRSVQGILYEFPYDPRWLQVVEGRRFVRCEALGRRRRPEVEFSHD